MEEAVNTDNNLSLKKTKNTTPLPHITRAHNSADVKRAARKLCPAHLHFLLIVGTKFSCKQFKVIQPLV